MMNAQIDKKSLLVFSLLGCYALCVFGDTAVPHAAGHAQNLTTNLGKTEEIQNKEKVIAKSQSDLNLESETNIKTNKTDGQSKLNAEGHEGHQEKDDLNKGNNKVVQEEDNANIKTPEKSVNEDHKKNTTSLGDDYIPPPPVDGGAVPLPGEEILPAVNISSLMAVDQPKPLSPKASDPNANNSGSKAGFGGPPAIISDDDHELQDIKASAAGEGSANEVDDGEMLLRCGVCPPGMGVATKCTTVKDTVCAPCPDGTYSPGYSSVESCRSCNSCPSGYFQRTPCVADSNAICGPCNEGGSGFGNEEFRRKCEGVSAPPSTTLPSEVSSGESSGDEINGNGQQEGADIDQFMEQSNPNKNDQDPINMLALDSPTPPLIEEVDVKGYQSEAIVGESREQEKVVKVKAGGFQWPILLAGILSGIVFFIVGIVTSMLCKRSRQERRKSVVEEDFGEDSVRTTMIRRSGEYSPSHASDINATSPLNHGKWSPNKD